MFGISFSEIVLILILCLIIFGPKQLPQIATKVGLLLFNLQQLWFKLRNEFYKYSGLNEIKQAQQDILHTYQQIKQNVTINQHTASHNNDINKSFPTELPQLYQAELDFDHQPELFDKP